MVYLNYNNLDAQTQENLIADSKKEIEQQFGEELKNYAKQYHLNYETLLQEEAIRNLYNFSYVFTI
jgi:hypothetical protein